VLSELTSAAPVPVAATPEVASMPGDIGAAVAGSCRRLLRYPGASVAPARRW